MTPSPHLLRSDFAATELPDTSAASRTCGVGTVLSLYLATVLDCFSRGLVGWSIAEHMRTELVENALDAAAFTRGVLAVQCSTLIS